MSSRNRYTRSTLLEHQSPNRGRGVTARRDILSVGIKALLAVTGGAVAFALRSSEKAAAFDPQEVEKNEILVTPERRTWASGELTANKIESFMFGFAALSRKEIILLDQNGNVVGGEPIPLPPELLAWESQPDEFKWRFQKWLNEYRAYLGKKYSTLQVSTIPKLEEPTLVSVRPSLGEGENRSFFEVVWTNAMERVSQKNPMSRYEYAKLIMGDLPIPEDLEDMFIALCATESQFSEIGENSVKASGPWQIMPALARHHGLMGMRGKKEFDDRNNFEKSTPVAGKILLGLYFELKTSDIIKEIQEQYHLADEDFLFPAIINSYQTGQSRVRNMCRWFKENYPPGKVQGILGDGPYGKDLYTLMSSLYAHAGVDGDYLKQSRDYAIRSMAFAELIRLKIQGQSIDFKEQDYVPPTPDVEPEYALAHEASGFRSHAGTIGVGLIAASVAQATTETMGRRRFLGMTVPYVGAAYAGRFAASLTGDEHRQDSIEEDAPKPEAPSERNRLFFGPYRLDETVIPKDLMTLPPPVIKKLTTEEMRSLKDPLRYGISAAQRHSLPKFPTCAEIVQAPGMVPVEPFSSPRYRLRGVGMLSDGNVDSDPRYCFVYRHTEQLIGEISDQLNEGLWRWGFPRKYRVRLIVKGLTRSEKFQQALRARNPYAAKGDSPHMFGHTFDLHRRKYDIVDEEQKTFSMISDAPGDAVNQKHMYTAKISAALGRVLLEMKQKGKLTVIHEGANPVYHVSDLEPLEAGG